MNSAVIAEPATDGGAVTNRVLAEISRLLPGCDLQAGDSRRHGGTATGKFYGSVITSEFQAWRRPGDLSTAAVEAYTRSHSKAGSGLSPWQNFAESAVDDDLVQIDRLCRTVHVLNHFGGNSSEERLVLNVDARLLQAVADHHGEFFGKVLRLLGIAPRRIVIDIHTRQLVDLSRLRQILSSYRRHGFAVAVNAEGMIHARTLANLLRPDVLMLDAGALDPASLARHAESLVRSGVSVAIKRIETGQQLDAARETGVDWVQGFHIDRLAAPPHRFIRHA